MRYCDTFASLSFFSLSFSKQRRLLGLYLIDIRLVVSRETKEQEFLSERVSSPVGRRDILRPFDHRLKMDNDVKRYVEAPC